MKYRSVVVTRRGGPDVFRIVEHALREPTIGETRIRILATTVSAPDIQARYGHTPFPPRIPFVPGYAIIGVVDAVGEGVTKAAAGDRVGALTITGGYAEYIYLNQDELIPVPVALDPAEAVTLILNYLVAYQVMHRSARVRSGDKVLIVGASGGIGTAFLQLGTLAHLTMFGLASRSKHHILVEHGATPIDYHTQDFVEVIRNAEPDGLNAVFDGMGGAYVRRGLSVLRHGGTLVVYGNPLSISGLGAPAGRGSRVQPAPEQEARQSVRNDGIEIQPAPVRRRLGCALQAARRTQDQTHHRKEVLSHGSGRSRCITGERPDSRQRRSGGA